MEVKGKIKALFSEQSHGSNNFRTRDIVITTDEQYPQCLSIQFTQDKCDLLNNYRIGQDVKISINLKGREWINPQGEAKYFNTIQGWRIELLNTSHQPQPQQAAPPPPPVEDYFEGDNNSLSEEPDDLPF